MNLDEFVAESDRLGGPGTPPCTDYWRNFTYQPIYQVDESLDPFSEAYVAEQMILYEEIAGRKYEIGLSEHTDFDLSSHIAASNPYNHPQPDVLAIHLQRLSRAFRLAQPHKAARLLDLGCGWGLSSEFAAYLGLTVEAVDINQFFTKLVSARAARSGAAINTTNASFEDFSFDEKFDLTLFYECLHHAIRPWRVLQRVAAHLNDGGRVILAGEPINSFWWKHWGLLLDPISIYCIRKFGWFESGWSLEFITAALCRNGLSPTTFNDPAEPDLGYTIVAKKQAGNRITGVAAQALFEVESAIIDGDNHSLILLNSGMLRSRFDLGDLAMEIDLCNYRGRPIQVEFRAGNELLLMGNLPAGRTTLRIPAPLNNTDLNFCVECWIPDEELQNGDRRIVGLHLESVGLLVNSTST